MALIEYWIQIENHPWDLCPRNRDRMKGLPIVAGPTLVDMKSPVTGFEQKQRPMFKPLIDEKDGHLHSALILRRYTNNWGSPDDRKVNPWDVNEPDPTDTGTMGTIPGPVIECKVGDSVLVHFRNLDLRREADGTLLPLSKRTHSLHPHGFVFERFFDGAYPLTPPDPGQPVGAEKNAWDQVGVAGSKQGDRIPPPSDPADPVKTAATFNYRWETHGWPTTAGVWLYHDHSADDMDNVEHGAIGIIVIHDDRDNQDVDIRDPADPTKYIPALVPGGAVNGSPVVSKNGQDVFIEPPAKTLFLQLFHALGHGSGMTINGRKYLGNTPTMLAGPESLMRFGVVGMNMEDFHTFHLHGHRWIVPGPDGSAPDVIQGSTLSRAVSQFEDTRLFGPANSFVFSIDERSTNAGLPSFMRAGGPNHADAKGEWHMHCHVLMHMGDGMMGSLVIAEGGDSANLQEANPLLLPPEEPLPANLVTVGAGGNVFFPATLVVAPGTDVTFYFKAGSHTVTTVSAQDANPIEINDGDSGTPVKKEPRMRVVKMTGKSGGVVNYECGIHGSSMAGSIKLV